MRSHARIGAVFAALAALLLMAGIAHADPAKIRIGWVGVPNSWAPMLEAKKDLARHSGKSYVLDLIRFKGTGEEIAALATGDLDIATLAFSAIAAAVQNAGLEDLRVILDEKQDGVPGTYSNEFMVLKSGPITKAEDLKGKVIATNAIGGGFDMAMRAWLRRHKLEDQRDYSVIEVALPNMMAVLVEGKAQLVTGSLPFSAKSEFRAVARPLFTMGEAFGGPVQAAALASRAGFLQKNRAAMVDFAEDTVRIIRWYLDPANHAEVVKVVARLSGLKPEDLDSWLFTKADNYRDPNGLPNLAAIRQNVEVERELGIVKTGLAIETYADLTIVEEALARLGPRK